MEARGINPLHMETRVKLSIASGCGIGPIQGDQL